MVPFYRYYNDLYSFTTIPNFPKENLKQLKKTPVRCSVLLSITSFSLPLQSDTNSAHLAETEVRLGRESILRRYFDGRHIFMLQRGLYESHNTTFIP